MTTGKRYSVIEISAREEDGGSRLLEQALNGIPYNARLHAVFLKQHPQFPAYVIITEPLQFS